MHYVCDENSMISPQVGDTISYNGRTFEVVESPAGFDCEGCYFYDNECGCCLPAFCIGDDYEGNECFHFKLKK